MANGDVLAATVISSDPYNGWVLEVTLEGLAGQTAATVAFGYASENTPSATTPYIDLTTEGYVGTTLGTHSMRLYLSDVIRKPYPDNASQDIRDSGSDIIVRIALSDYVYNDDTAVTFTAPVGWLVVGATNAGAVTGFAVTNSSTQDYPQAFMTWTMLPFMRQSGDFNLSCIARCVNGVAAVRFDATGAVSTNNVNATIDRETGHLFSASGMYISEFTTPVAIAGFTQAEQINCRARVYPTRGDADSIHDTDAYSDDSRVWGPVTMHCNKTGGLTVYAVVDPAGNDTTGVSSTSLAAAEAAPFATIGKAAQGRVGAAANTIYLNNGTYAAVGASPTANISTGHFFIVTWHPTNASRAGVMVQFSGSTTGTRRYGVTKFMYRDLNTQATVTSGWLDGTDIGGSTATNTLYLVDCDYDPNGVGNNTAPFGFKAPVCTFYNSTGITAVQLQLTSSASNYVAHRLVGSLLEGAAFAMNACAGIIGCATVSGTLPRYAMALATNPAPLIDGVFFESNYWTDFDSTSAGFTNGLDRAYTKVSICGNVWEKTAGTNGILVLFGDSSAVNAANVINCHNTFAGERYNGGYNDQGSTPYYRYQWTEIGNCFDSRNLKLDLDGTPNGARIGPFPLLYGVAMRDNHHIRILSAAFLQAWGGLGFTINSSAGFTNDQSGAGNPGNGNYTPAGGSIMLDRLSTEFRMGVDIYGKLLLDGGSLGAIQVNSAPDAGPDKSATTTTTAAPGTVLVTMTPTYEQGDVITWDYTAGNEAGYFDIDDDGVNTVLISPAVPGVYVLTAQITGSFGTDTATVTITVNGPAPDPGSAVHLQGNLGFGGPVVHTDEYYRELEDRRQRKQAVTERIVEEVGEESARVFVEQAKVDARRDEPLPPPANLAGLAEIYRALVELERGILDMEAREAQDREARRRQDDEDAILALLMA